MSKKTETKDSGCKYCFDCGDLYETSEMESRGQFYFCKPCEVKRGKKESEKQKTLERCSDCGKLLFKVSLAKREGKFVCIPCINRKKEKGTGEINKPGYKDFEHNTCWECGGIFKTEELIPHEKALYCVSCTEKLGIKRSPCDAVIKEMAVKAVKACHAVAKKLCFDCKDNVGIIQSYPNIEAKDLLTVKVVKYFILELFHQVGVQHKLQGHLEAEIAQTMANRVFKEIFSESVYLKGVKKT